jgi:DNA-binding NtrC family response regulator
MRKPPAIETSGTGIVSVLSVSPTEEVHFSLQHIFNHSKWKLTKTHSLASALAILHAQTTPVVLCETDLLPGTWRDLLEQIARAPNAPAVIVSSRLADDRLWAEALNLGAWDVLARPFVESEVFRAVSAAWRHWWNGQERPASALPSKNYRSWPGSMVDFVARTGHIGLAGILLS